VTILTGENGVGKSTLLEGIASLAGYDEAGGGKGYRPVDHSRAVEAMGGRLADALRASWLPKVTEGWFFRAESFFSVARYLDEAAIDVGGAPPNFLSHSHGEGFLRFFEERCRRRGLFIFDEPESALSPSRQIQFLKILTRMANEGGAQVVMATHSPLLMAYPDAQLLTVSMRALTSTRLVDTEHFRLLRHFYADPVGFLERALHD
jgi:predicted ATPase